MSQVVHNRGHGFSKRFNPAGVYQLPITRLRTHAHYKAPHTRPSLSVATHYRQQFYDLVPRDPKRQVPLTNNGQIRVAPGETTPNSKVDRTLESISTVCRRFG